jgi:hypothetical protein
MRFDDEGFYPLRHLRRIRRTVFGEHFQCRMRATINTAMVISSGWSLKNLSSCSDNACKALSASLTISFRRWRVGSAPKQPILLPPCREVIVCL